MRVVAGTMTDDMHTVRFCLAHNIHFVSATPTRGHTPTSSLTHVLREPDRVVGLEVPPQLRRGFALAWLKDIRSPSPTRLAASECVPDRFGMFVNISLPTEVTVEQLLRHCWATFRQFIPKAEEQWVLDRCIVALARDAPAVQGHCRARLVWPRFLVDAQQALTMRERLVFELTDLEATDTHPTECRWHELVEYGCYAPRVGEGLPLIGAAHAESCVACAGGAPRRAVRAGEVLPTCHACLGRGVRFGATPPLLPVALYQRELSADADGSSFYCARRLSEDEAPRGSLKSATSARGEGDDSESAMAEDELRLECMLHGSAPSLAGGAEQPTAVDWRRASGTPFFSFERRNPNSAPVPYPTGSIHDFSSGAPIVRSRRATGAPPRAELDAPVVKLLERAIRLSSSLNHSRVIVTRNGAVHEPKRSRYVVSVIGIGCHTCNKARGEHDDSRVYFVITPNGVQQCCHSRQRLDNGQECRSFASEPVKMSGRLRRCLFPGLPSDGLANKIAYGSAYHLACLVTEHHRMSIAGRKRRRTSIFGFPMGR